MKKVTWKRGIAMTLAVVLLLIVFSASLYNRNLNLPKNQMMSMAQAEGEQESAPAKPIDDSSGSVQSTQKEDVGKTTESVENSSAQSIKPASSDSDTVADAATSETLEGSGTDGGNEGINENAIESDSLLATGFNETDDALPEDEVENNGEGTLLDSELIAEDLTYSFAAELSETVFGYDGNEKQPNVIVKDGETILDEGAHYELVRPETSVNEATYTIVVTGLNQYAECMPIELTYRIILPQAKPLRLPTPVRLDSYIVTLENSDAVYNGKPQEPIFTIQLDDDEVLEEGIDYEFEIEGGIVAIDADDYPVTIIGKGDFVGQSLSETFSIAPFDLAKAVVKPSAQVFWYTGNVIEPGFALFFEDGVTPIPSANYKPKYDNSIAVDDGYTAGVVLLNGNLVGSISFEYNIKECVLKIAETTYNGQVQTPTLTLSIDGAPLQENVDYELVDMVEEKDADRYPVTIRGIGTHAGQRSGTFVILPFDLAKAFVQPDSQDYWYSGEIIEPSFPLFFEEGGIEIPSDDYEVKYGNSIEVKDGYTAYITYTDNGNLTGENEFTYNIKQYKAQEATVNPSNGEGGWYIKDNPVKLTAPNGHVFVQIAGVDIEDAEEYVITDDTIYDESGSSVEPYKAGEISISYRLKCCKTGKDYGALTAIMEIKVKQDTGFAGLDRYDITTRDASIFCRNKSGEKAYALVYINGQNPDMKKWDIATVRSEWAQDSNLIENGNTEEYSLSTHIRTTEYDDHEVANYLTVGTEVIVFARDYAGNINNWEFEIKPYQVKPLTISGPQDVARSGGEFLIQGEPDEVVLLTHTTVDNFTCYIKLDKNGAAKVVIDPAKGIFVEDSEGNVLCPMVGDIFIYDSETEHLLQQLKVEYVDKENIIHKDGSRVKEDSISFLYHSKAFPISADPKLENRALKIVITLPEEGTVTGVRANGVELLTSTGTVAGKGEAVTYDLHWANAPKLFTAGTGALKIEYKDLGGEVGEGVFDISRSTVTEPVLMQIEPETNANGYFGKNNKNIVIFGTSTEYEPISVHVGSRVLSVNSSGTGGYVQTEKGNWSIPLELSALPKNQEIVVSASYRDVNGPRAEMTIKYDDECMPIIVVTTTYEGARYLAGITEPGAIVRVYCADETIKAKVDSEGYFLAELPMLFEGETIEIKAYDLAGNLQELTLTVGEKPEPIKAHVKGKLFPQYDLDKIDWLQEKRVSREELEGGLVLPILAGNLFPVGEMQVRLVNGEVEIGYSMLFPELEVRDEYFVIHTNEVDRVDLLNRRIQGLIPGKPMKLQEADAYWIYASLQVVLTPEQMEDDLEAYLVKGE